MAKFKSKQDQGDFIRDTNDLFNKILTHFPEDPARTDYMAAVRAYQDKWDKIFKVQPETPLTDLIVSERQRIEKLYIELKASVVYYSRNVIDIQAQEIENINTTEECLRALRKLLAEEKNKKVDLKTHQYLIGKVLHKLKQLSPSDKIFVEYAKQVTGLGRTQARKLIQFFTICEEFPLLRYTALPTETILKSYEYLLPYIKEDKIFWEGADIRTLTISSTS